MCFVRAAFQGHFMHRDTHRRVGQQAGPCCGHAWKIGLVEQNVRRNAGVLGSDERACQLRLAEHRFGRDQHEQQVDVRGERLGLPFVLPEQQVAARLEPFDHTFVTRRLPTHPVAHDHVALLPTRMTDQPHAVGRLDHAVAAVHGHHQAHIKCCV